MELQNKDSTGSRAPFSDRETLLNRVPLEFDHQHDTVLHGSRNDNPVRSRSNSNQVVETEKKNSNYQENEDGSSSTDSFFPLTLNENSPLMSSIERIGDSIVGNDTTMIYSIGGEGTTWFGGMIIMANVCIGMAMLNFPRTIAVAGGLLPTGILSTIFILLIIFSLGMTAYCCRYYGSVTYQDMVITSCGRFAGYLCKFFLLLETLGSCIVKLVVFADQLERIVRIINEEEYKTKWYLKRNFTMPVVTTLMMLPFCLLKNFQLFKYTSAFGILAAFYIAFGVAMVRYLTGVPLPTNVIPVSGSPDFVALLPLLVYAFHGHVEAPVVFCGLRRNRIFYFMRMVYGYLFMAVIVYTGTALFGYLTFGRFADEDLLLSYPNDDVLVNVAMILVIVKLLTSFPVVFYILRSVVDDAMRGSVYDYLPRCLRNQDIRRVVETLVLFSFCVVISAVVPNLKSAIHLIGGISCNLAFTFPGLCFMIIHLRRDRRLVKNFVRIIIGALYILIGVFLTGTNTTYAVLSYLNEPQ